MLENSFYKEAFSSTIYLVAAAEERCDLNSDLYS